MITWGTAKAIVTGSKQYTMEPDFMGLALADWKKLNPSRRRRESDLGPGDRDWIISRAKELKRRLAR